MRGPGIQIIPNLIIGFSFMLFYAHHPRTEAVNQLEPLVNKLLLGDLWKFNEYCGLSRDESTILSEDSVIRSLYNGTLLDSSVSDWHESVEKLSKLEQVGLKARESLPIICSSTSWGYADETTKSLSDGPTTNAAECDLEIDRLLDTVQNLVRVKGPRYESGGKFEPLSWLQVSSFARLSSGPQYNNHIWLGDYETCLKTGQKMVERSFSNGTRYCYGLYGRPGWNLTTKPKSVSEGFRIGLCMPASCSTARAQLSLHKLNQLLKLIYLSDFLFLTTGLRNDTKLAADSTYSPDSHDLQLLDVYCLPQPDSAILKLLPNPVERGFSVSLLNIILLLVLPIIWITTLASHWWLKESKNTLINKWLLRCFDVKKNLLSFCDSKHTIKRLRGLNGIKVLSMIWLMLTHNYLLMLSYSDNLETVRWRRSILSAFILNGQHGVPIFFIISGFLVGYRLFGHDERDKNMENRQQKYLSMILWRYLRLAPLYLVCYAYIKQFAHLIGHGPLWDYGVSLQSESRQCSKESWMIPILMMANFIPPFTHCVITGWHIANDMQIYFLLPILIYLYRKSKVLGRCLVGFCFLLTHYTHMIQWGTAKNYNMLDLSQEPFLLGARVVVDRLSYDYVNPLGRLGTYFLGFLVADFVFEQKKLEHSSRIKDSSIMVVAAILWSSFFTVLVPDELKLLLIKDDQASKFITYPFIRISVELGWAIMIYCLLRYRIKHPSDEECSVTSKVLSQLACFLRLPVWNVLVKLNYSIMLTHFTISRWMVQSQLQLTPFTWFGYAQFNLLYLVIVYKVNLVIHIFIELPITSLIKTLIRKSD